MSTLCGTVCGSVIKTEQHVVVSLRLAAYGSVYGRILFYRMRFGAEFRFAVCSLELYFLLLYAVWSRISFYHMWPSCIFVSPLTVKFIFP